MSASAFIIECPPDGGSGGPVVWLQTDATWEQCVCVYEKVGDDWQLRGTKAKSGVGGRMEIFTISSSTTYRTFLVWLLHKTSPYDGNLDWLNSPMRLSYIGKNTLVDMQDNRYRNSQVVCVSEDSTDNDFNDGIAYFTHSSFLGFAKVEPVTAKMPDAWKIAPPSISI